MRAGSEKTVGADSWSSGGAYEGYIGRWSRLVAPQFLDWLAVPLGWRWVDVGCGTGVLTEAILARCEPRSVVAVEPSAPFRTLARQHVGDRRAMFVEGTAARTGLYGGDADVLVSGLVLNFVPDLGEALAEARRLVVPGGVVAAYVWDYAEGMQFIRRFWDAAVVVDPAAQGQEQGVRFAHTAPAPLVGAFAAAGLESVEIRPIEIPTVFRDFDDLWTPFLSGTGPAPAYAMSLTEPARDALRERLRVAVPAERDGSIHLTARAWAVRARRPL